jgi:ATP-binding cassette, subfamily G (WHITE), member 2, SNQ2
MALSAESVTVEGDPHSLVHVDVSYAKDSFNELSRQLTHKSNASSTVEGEGVEKDVEKGNDGTGGDQAFDLREYLTSVNDANLEAGIKHKHVGVTWEDLQVEIFGGVGDKVS